MGIAVRRVLIGLLLALALVGEMLARSGANPASHTRWLAREEILRAPIGLKRWAEADARHQTTSIDLRGKSITML